MAIYRTLNNAAGLAHILAFLGDLAWNMGDYRAARGWIEQGLAKQATVADPELLANLLNLLGIVALHQGNLVEAERLQGEALATAQSVGRIGRHEKFHLGVTLVWAGRFSAGYQLLSERIQQADSEGMPGALAAAYVHTGEALLHLGRYRDARKLVCQGLEIANVHKSPRLMGDTLRMLGQIELAERRFSEASTHLHESIAALRTIDQLGSLGWSLATLGYVAYFMGNLPTARSHLREALQIAKETTAFFPLLMAMPACALLYLAQEEPARTLELYALATRYPLVANSCWFAEIVGRSITNTAGRLHPHLQETAYRPECIADPWAVAAIILDDLR
ncbi:MAG: tetratricopeptide repeat protein [Caldilineaceae bacterium]